MPGSAVAAPPPPVPVTITAAAATVPGSNSEVYVTAIDGSLGPPDSPAADHATTTGATAGNPHSAASGIPIAAANPGSLEQSGAGALGGQAGRNAGCSGSDSGLPCQPYVGAKQEGDMDGHAEASAPASAGATPTGKSEMVEGNGQSQREESQPQQHLHHQQQPLQVAADGPPAVSQSLPQQNAAGVTGSSPVLRESQEHGEGEGSQAATAAAAAARAAAGSTGMGATVAAAAAAHAAAAAAHQGRFFPLPQPPALPHSGGNHSGNVPGYRLLARSMTGGEAGSRMDGNMGASGGGIFVSSSSSSVTKQRLRWTPELHERFVDAVTQLGGPDRKLALPEREGKRTASDDGDVLGVRLSALALR